GNGRFRLIQKLLDLFQHLLLIGVELTAGNLFQILLCRPHQLIGSRALAGSVLSACTTYELNGRLGGAAIVDHGFRWWTLCRRLARSSSIRPSRGFCCRRVGREIGRASCRERVWVSVAAR